MSEPILLKLTAPGNFDGVTTITRTRGDFTVQGQRLYTSTSPVTGGIVPADIFGFFAPEAPKLVGVATSSFNPLGMARVLASDNSIREEINLTPRVQYVLLHAGDRLAVLTKESPTRGADLTLVVNELSEANHMQWALHHPAESVHTRFRIIRTGGNFVPNPPGGSWIPAWEWDAASNILVVTDNTNNAPIPISALSPFPRNLGSLVSIRYAGSNNDGRFILVENSTRRTWEAQATMADVRWSRVQYAAHDDLISLSATLGAGGGPLVCDIEVVRVEPGDRLRGRFTAPETNTSNNL